MTEAPENATPKPSILLVDDDEAFDKVQAYMRTFMPRAGNRLVRYSERMPLFSRYQLEEQIDRIYRRSVELPGGGSIVITASNSGVLYDREMIAYATSKHAVVFCGAGMPGRS